MSRSRTLLALAFAALCLAPLATPASARTKPRPAVDPRGPDTAHDRVARGLAAAIARDVADLRGLPIRRPLQVRVMSTEALRAFVLRELRSGGGSAHLARLGRALALVGLAPPGGGLEAAYITLLKEQVAGLYDPASKQLRIRKKLIPTGLRLPNPLHLITGSPEDQLRFVMAHEIVHALQDQRWKLRKLARDRRGETDLETALSSLFEGDATLGGLLWAMKDKQGHADLRGLLAAQGALRWMLDGSLALARLGLLPGGAGLAKAPVFLQERLVVPYTAGLSLCLAAVRRTGDYKGVDALYKRPPLSTEQVLHPEKLWAAKPDPPVILRLPRRLWRGQGKALLRDGLGELFIRVALAQRLPDAVARRAAAGWGGDRYVLLAGKGGDALVWLTTWDTDDDAGEFQAAAARWLQQLDANGPRSGLLRRGRDVLVLRGVPKARWQSLAKRVFAKTRRSLRTRLPR